MNLTARHQRERTNHDTAGPHYRCVLQGQPRMVKRGSTGELCFSDSHPHPLPR